MFGLLDDVYLMSGFVDDVFRRLGALDIFKVRDILFSGVFGLSSGIRILSLVFSRFGELDMILGATALA